MTSVDMSDRWANRDAALEILGISNAALILLRRDGVLTPDCVSCGRIRWKVSELHARKDEIHQYLNDTYGMVSGTLTQYTRNANMETSQ